MAKGKGKGKRTYHRPPAPKNTLKRPIRLSQCMIVKNEEKNIERALSWAKGIAFEQIVVDTGSTDRTVDIAESMGATVYHFKWINDFSAAKNYAIDQAKGDWIAFLDADEWFPDEDAKKLMLLLNKIENDPLLAKKKNTSVVTQWIQLNDEGKPFLVLSQQRIFRNVPEIRYKGTIHEDITVPYEYFDAPELSIMHTGYQNSAFEETNKAARNVELLRKELEANPESADLKCYLAESLHAMGDDESSAEAYGLYAEVIAYSKPMLRELRQQAYTRLITSIFDIEEKNSETFDLCSAAYGEFPENPDFCYYYGRRLYIKGDYAAAWDKYIESENLLKRDQVDIAGYIISHSVMLFFQMVVTAEELGNTSEIIRCATLALKEDKYQPGLLAPYIQAFNRPGFETSADELFELLGRLYDFSDTKDKITVMGAAKDAGNMPLVGKILSAFTSEELQWLTEGMK